MEKIKEFSKKKWFWAVVVILVLGIIGASTSGDSEKDSSSNSNTKTETKTETKTSKKEVTVIDFSSMLAGDISAWCKENNLTDVIKEEYSDSIAKGSFVSQSVASGDKVTEGSKIIITYSLGKKPTQEYKNALKKAESYSKTLHMSKQGIYDQLTSEYGEKFPSDAAQYAIDNMTADWNANALAKAKTYQKTMNMSKSSIYDQLISEYGEKFTEAEAQYAIDHLDD